MYCSSLFILLNCQLSKSNDTVYYTFIYIALNDLEVKAADIQNAYLMAPISEKSYLIFGPEFGPELEERRTIIARPLYGTKTAGRDFRNHLQSCMEMLNYKAILADPDVWTRGAFDDKEVEYSEMMLLYVDNYLAIGSHVMEELKEFNEYFLMKKESMGDPKIHLGAKVGKTELPNGVEADFSSMSQYIQETVSNVEKLLKEKGFALKKKENVPMAADYSLEIDGSAEIYDRDSTFYQLLIG